MTSFVYVYKQILNNMRKSTRTQSLFLEDSRLCCYPSGTTLFSSANFYNRRVMAALWIVSMIAVIVTITFVLDHVSRESGKTASLLLHYVFRVARAIEDCPIGSVMYCPENKACISNNQRCDRFQDCPDDRDEINCTCRRYEFSCKNGPCIPDKFLCDRVHECPNGDDESDEVCGPCHENQMRCRKTKKCIHRKNICDGRVDCPGNDDEENCAEVLKSYELILTNRGEKNHDVCAHNWVKEMAENVCRYLGYKKVSTFSKYKKNADRMVSIIGFQYYKYLVVIKSARIRNCIGNEFVKLECDSEGMCGRRHFPSKMNKYIIDGLSSSPGQWPWHARLSCDGGLCGSSIVNDWWIVTAAHCFFNKSGNLIPPDNCIVMVGTINVYSKSIVHRIQRIVIHPRHSFMLINYDVAMVKLATRLVFNPYVQPICLPRNYSRTHDFRTCVGIGFGKTIKGKVSPTILHSKMVEYERTFCSPNRHRAKTEMCIGTRPGLGNINICMGDSGGSFSCQRPNEDRWFIMGIFSYVSARAQNVEEHELCQASMASRVTYFLNFIQTSIRDNS